MSHHRVMIRVLMVVNVMFIMRSGNMSSVVGSRMGTVRSRVVGGWVRSIGSWMVRSWMRSIRSWVIRSSVMHMGFRVVWSGSWVIGSGSRVIGSWGWVVRSRGRVVRCWSWVIGSWFGVHVRFMMMNRVNGVNGGMVSSVVRHMIGRLLQGGIFQGS